MKKSLLLLTLISCIALSFTSSVSKSTNYLNGTWDEYWGVELGSDVSDVDRLEIVAVSSSNITIRCTTSDHYEYTKIKAKGKKFTFTMQNLSSSEPFYVYYTLKKVNNDLIKGMIENSKGVKTDVQLRRVKNSN